MLKNTLKTFIKNGIALSFIFAGALALHADALTISPVRMEVSADPGQVYEGEYTLTNDSPVERIYYNSFQKFQAQGESATPFFLPETTGLSSWLRGPETVRLAPFESKTLSFTVNVPVDAEPGGYFAAIFWMSQAMSATQGTVSSRLGLLVMLRVNGDILEEGGVIEFNTYKKFYTQSPIDMYSRFQNDGNDRLFPKGDIVITNLFGKTVGILDANEVSGNILPVSKRRFEFMWEGDIDPRELNFFAKVKRQWDNFHIGPYTAKMDVTYGATGQLSDTAQVRFWILPLQLLSVTIGFLILIFILIRLIKRSMRKAVESRVGDMEAKLRAKILGEEAEKNTK